MIRPWFFSAGIIVMFAVLGSGCGGAAAQPTGRVSGKVTLQGQPPNEQGLQLTLFEKSRGTAASTTLNQDGTFAFAEPVPAGNYTVVLNPPAPTEAAGAEPPKLAPTKIPDKFRSEVTSDKLVTVEARDNSLSIDLQ